MIPAVLHVAPLVFVDYPEPIKAALREWVLLWLAGGQLNPMVVHPHG